MCGWSALNVSTPCAVKSAVVAIRYGRTGRTFASAWTVGASETIVLSTVTAISKSTVVLSAVVVPISAVAKSIVVPFVVLVVIFTESAVVIPIPVIVAKSVVVPFMVIMISKILVSWSVVSSKISVVLVAIEVVAHTRMMAAVVWS